MAFATERLSKEERGEAMGQQRRGRGASGTTTQGKESKAGQDKQSQGGNEEEAGDWNESKATENRRSRDGKQWRENPNSVKDEEMARGIARE